MSDCAVAARPCLTLVDSFVPAAATRRGPGELVALAMESPAVRRLFDLVTARSTSSANDVAQLRAVLSRQPDVQGRLITILDEDENCPRRETDALNRLLDRTGPEAVRAGAAVVLLRDLAEEAGSGGPLDVSAVWRHMLWTGLCARALAVRTRWADPDSAMMAGLLHDIGLMIEDRYVPELLAAALDGRGGFLTEHERQQLGFDHTVLGRRLLEAWEVPDGLAAAVRHHHRSEACGGPQAGLARCVEVADVLCTLRGVAATRFPATRMPTDALAGCLLARGQLRCLVAEAEGEAFRYESVLSRAAGRPRGEDSAAAGPRLAAGTCGAGL